MAKRVPVSEFQEQTAGQQGVKAITLAVGDALTAMHACIHPGELRTDTPKKGPASRQLKGHPLCMRSQNA